MALANSTITIHLSLCSQDPARGTQHRIFTFVASRQNASVCLNKSGDPGALGWGVGGEAWGVRQLPVPKRSFLYEKCRRGAWG